MEFWEDKWEEENVCRPLAGETENAGVHCEWILGEQQGKVHFLGEQHPPKAKKEANAYFT